MAKELSEKIVTRLTRLADKLEGVGPYAEDGPIPEKHFHLGFWSACQTVGCACGVAALDPWFHERGLRLAEAGHVANPNGGGMVQNYVLTYGSGYGDDNRAFGAVRSFFGFNEHFPRYGHDGAGEVASYLFEPSAYPADRQRDPLFVAERIRLFLKSGSVDGNEGHPQKHYSH